VGKNYGQPADDTRAAGWEKISVRTGGWENTSYLPPHPACSIMKMGIIMHEYSITESILSLALEKANEAKAGKITRINLVLGEMSGVVAECVQFYFDHISRDTPASSAGLSFETRPTRVRCHKCETIFTPKDSDWSCPGCREIGIEIISGRECYMESIEVE
jgi:hydrogenase nickel incorporation protein HypA/HybF